MMHGDGGKLDQRRPGKGFDEGFERIWGKKEACDCQQGKCKEVDAAKCRDWNKRGGK